MSGARFAGFPKELPDFLWGIALHNEKPWFEARRDVYERCLHGPVKALGTQMTEALAERFPDERFALHISRIFRDARNLRGGGPLNDHMWFSIGRTGRVYAEEPQFFFAVEARRCEWGVGYWNVSADTMERWRRSIDANPGRLSRIVRGIGRMEGMERIGELYKRPKGDPGPLLYDWYNTRVPGAERIEWFEPDPPGPELADRIAADFFRLMPLYRYFLEF